MEAFSQRLRNLRENVGLSVENLAVLLDMSASAVRCLEEGYNLPTIETLMRISEIFNVSPGYAAMISDDASVCEDSSIKEVYLLDRMHNSTSGNVVNTVYISRKDMHGKDYSALVMMDDSMTRARIFEGDELIVSRQNYASNGEIVVALMADGREVVRRYMRVGNIVTLVPECDNPKYKTEKVDVSEEAFSVLGIVHEIRISIK